MRKRPDQGAWWGVATYLGVAAGLLLGLVGAASRLGGPAAAGMAGLAMFTPALAAMATRLARREGFAEAGLRPGPWHWYGIAWGLPVLMVGMDFGWLWVAGRARFAPSAARLAALDPYGDVRDFDDAIPGVGADQAVLIMALASLTVANLPMIAAGFGEEFGWRGYLLPRLSPLGIWPAFAIVGLVWWAWHLPLGWIATVRSGAHPALAHGAGLLGAVLFGAVLGWLRAGSGSIFPAALAHITYNNATGAGHMCFDVDFDAIVAVRVLDVALACAIVGWLGGWDAVRRSDWRGPRSRRSAAGAATG